MAKNPFRYFKTSPEIIQLGVLMYVRFPLSLRNVEDLLHERGIDVCHESVRLWVDRFGIYFAHKIRKRSDLSPLAPSFILRVWPFHSPWLEVWRAAGRIGRPGVIAIVDQSPENQYLYPDMLMAQHHLQQAGIETLIVDPAALTYRNEELCAGSSRVEMVYNRLTDFDLSEPGNAALRQALMEDAAIVSPAPRHHAMYADKRNLIWLSDADLLRSWGLPEAYIHALGSMPRTQRVSAETADELWTARKGFFFKPAAGFGSRATYRGDKLTKRVWSDILEGNYIAQAFVPPTLRAVTVENEKLTLKYDVRLYTYAGETLLVAARVYQGQTTNFRTSGGGFGVVYQF